VPAEEALVPNWHSHSNATADLSGYLHISLAPLRMSQMRIISQRKKPLDSLHRQISGFMAILFSSHGQNPAMNRVLNLFHLTDIIFILQGLIDPFQDNFRSTQIDLISL